jgi:hypothetical protein
VRNRNPENDMTLKPSRAVLIIERLLRDQAFDVAALSRALVVRPQTLDAYRAGTEPVPLDRQLCLALVLIEHADAKLARIGHQLKGQVYAAMRYEQQVTATHDGPPITFRRT